MGCVGRHQQTFASKQIGVDHDTETLRTLFGSVQFWGSWMLHTMFELV